MNTIVLNTLNGATTEHALPLDCVTPTHAGSHDGLFALGGDVDGVDAIEAVVTTGKTLWGDSRRKAAPWGYFSMSGAGEGLFTVHGASQSWSYPFTVRSKGVSRAQTGRGIFENYLAFTYRNIAGVDFILDRLEIMPAVYNTRRI